MNNNVTNATTGVITVGDDSSGIFVAGNSTATNRGAITIGDSFGAAAGIFAIVQGIRIARGRRGGG